MLMGLKSSTNDASNPTHQVATSTIRPQPSILSADTRHVKAVNERPWDADSSSTFQHPLSNQRTQSPSYLLPTFSSAEPPHRGSLPPMLDHELARHGIPLSEIRSRSEAQWLRSPVGRHFARYADGMSSVKSQIMTEQALQQANFSYQRIDSESSGRDTPVGERSCKDRAWEL